jgi:hypothetical protein
MVMNLQWCISSFFNRQVVLIRTRSMLYFEVRLSKEKGETFALNYLSLTLMDVFQLNDGNQLTCCTMSWLLLKLNLPILIISKCPLLACLFFLSFHSFLYILIVCTLHCYSYTIDQLRMLHWDNNEEGCQCRGGVWNKFREGRRKVELVERIYSMKKVLMVECTYLISRSGWFHVHISLIFACLQMLWRGVRVCVCVCIYIYSS